MYAVVSRIMGHYGTHYDYAKHDVWCAAAVLDPRIRALFDLPYGMYNISVL